MSIIKQATSFNARISFYNKNIAIILLFLLMNLIVVHFIFLISCDNTILTFINKMFYYHICWNLKGKLNIICILCNYYIDIKMILKAAISMETIKISNNVMKISILPQIIIYMEIKGILWIESFYKKVYIYLGDWTNFTHSKLYLIGRKISVSFMPEATQVSPGFSAFA